MRGAARGSRPPAAEPAEAMPQGVVPLGVVPLGVAPLGVVPLGVAPQGVGAYWSTPRPHSAGEVASVATRVRIVQPTRTSAASPGSATSPANGGRGLRPALARPLRLGPTVCGVWALGLFLAVQQAAAFPASDASDPSVVPPASAASPDASDASALAHQLRLLGPYSSSVGPGWTFTPSLTLQEAFNDNVFQTETDRRWDLISYVSPGLAAYGDTRNIQLRLNYAPTLEYYARSPSLNQIAQDLNAIADVTLWPDHLYLDLRAVAGVGSTSGSTPGLGYAGSTPGQPATGVVGLTKQNSTQYTSFAASPYYLQQFDTYGTLKIGYTLSYSTSSNSGGLVPLPTSASGTGTSQTGNEGLIQFTTGTILDRITDTTLLDAKYFQGTGGLANTGHDDTVTNQVNYVFNRSVTAFGSVGYEDIDYTGSDTLAIHDITWQIGTTLTPNPTSTLTLSYGHQQGADYANVDGLYMVSARTSINVSYGQTLGTELQSLQSQLAQEDINNSGVAVNSRTGAPLNTSTNLLGTPSSLYRATTATVGTSTQLDRDTITVNIQYADYTAAGSGATGATSGITGTANWLHSISDDLTLNVSGAYGIRWFTDPGGENKFAAVTASLRYAISATLSCNLSYTFYDLNSTQAGQTLYQDILILSLTKQF